MQENVSLNIFLNMMCSRSDSEHTWADLRHIRNIFKGHFRSTLEICENSVFSDYELLGDII